MEQDTHKERIQSAKKVELHCHLELAIRQSTLRKLALERGYDVQTEQAFTDAFLIDQPMGQLQSVLHKFLNTRDILDSAELMEQVAFEVCEDMYLVQCSGIGVALCAQFSSGQAHAHDR
jgi:adenosine deaminase